MAHHNFWEDNGLYRVFTDKVNGDEIYQSNLSLHGDFRFDDIKYVLNDFSSVNDFQILEDDVTAVAVTDNVAVLSKPVLKIAIIATHKSLLNWIYKYCDKMKNSPYECNVFDNLDDAREWVAS